MSPEAEGVAPHGTLVERKSDLLGFPEREQVRVMRWQDPEAAGDRMTEPLTLPSPSRGEGSVASSLFDVL